MNELTNLKSIRQQVSKKPDKLGENLLDDDKESKEEEEGGIWNSIAKWVSFMDAFDLYTAFIQTYITSSVARVYPPCCAGAWWRSYGYHF